MATRHAERSSALLQEELEEEEEAAAELALAAQEAAALAAKRRDPVLPRGLDKKTLTTARDRLVQEAGLQSRDAEEALLAVVEQHLDDIKKRQYDIWLEEALLYIATNNEIQDEAAELRRAMDVSLAEQQARREAEEAEARTRSRQLSAEQLQKRYVSSQLLRVLAPVLGPQLLVEAPVREPLEQLLKLEHQCRVVWYPGGGTEEYFSQLSGQCVDLTNRLSGSSGQPGSSQTAAAATAANPKTSKGSDQGPNAGSSSTGTPSPAAGSSEAGAVGAAVCDALLADEPAARIQTDLPPTGRKGTKRSRSRSCTPEEALGVGEGRRVTRRSSRMSSAGGSSSSNTGSKAGPERGLSSKPGTKEEQGGGSSGKEEKGPAAAAGAAAAARAAAAAGGVVTLGAAQPEADAAAPARDVGRELVGGVGSSGCAVSPSLGTVAQPPGVAVAAVVSMTRVALAGPVDSSKGAGCEAGGSAGSKGGGSAAAGGGGAGASAAVRIAGLPLPALEELAGWLTEIREGIKVEVARMPDTPCAIPDIFKSTRGIGTVQEQDEDDEGDVQLVTADQLAVKPEKAGSGDKGSPARFLQQEDEPIIID